METEKMNGHQTHPSTPLAPPTTYGRSDGESTTAQEQHRKKRRNHMLCVATIVILLVTVILVFALVVMRFKTPRFRLRSVTFTSFQADNNSTDPALNLVLNAQFALRNRNYGRYMYDSATVIFAYKGLILGQAFIDESRARARTTKKIKATAVLSSEGLARGDVFDQLARDIRAGSLSVTSQCELEGKVRVVRVIKKRKNTRLNCTMDVEIATRSVTNLICL